MKTGSLLRLLVLALLAAGCSIEIQQTPAAALPVSTQSISPTSASAFPATHVPVTWSSLNLAGKLMYLSSTSDGNTKSGTIEVLDLATGELATILSAPNAWVYYATISPDAKWIAMSYSVPGQGSSSSNRILYVMPVDSAALPQPIFEAPTPDDHYTQVEWPPDGKYIYYVHYNHNDSDGQPNEVYQIFRMAYPDGKAEKIVDHAYWPRLSTDSSKLTYVSLDPASGANALFVANADGSHPQQVALSGPSIPDIIDAPVFLPDNQSILFSAPSPGQSYTPNWFERVMGIQVAQAHNIPSDWWSVRMAGGVPQQLTRIQDTGLFASLSPDQKHIASLSAEGIFVMDLDGSNLTRVISDPGVHGTVSWIP